MSAANATEVSNFMTEKEDSVYNAPSMGGKERERTIDDTQQPDFCLTEYQNAHIHSRSLHRETQ
jgi:hypothetical protein